MAKEKETETKEATSLRKISVKTVVGRVPAVPEKGTLALMIVYGQAQGSIVGENDYGEHVALVGTFEAVNLSTGEVFSAPKCFIPAGYDKMIAQRLGDGKTTAVDFAFEISVKAPSGESNQRYEYIVKPVRGTDAVDPLAATRKLVGGHPRLAAPSK